MGCNNSVEMEWVDEDELAAIEEAMAASDCRALASGASRSRWQQEQAAAGAHRFPSPGSQAHAHPPLVDGTAPRACETRKPCAGPSPGRPAPGGAPSAGSDVFRPLIPSYPARLQHTANRSPPSPHPPVDIGPWRPAGAPSPPPSAPRGASEPPYAPGPSNASGPFNVPGQFVASGCHLVLAPSASSGCSDQSQGSLLPGGRVGGNGGGDGVAVVALQQKTPPLPAVSPTAGFSVNGVGAGSTLWRGPPAVAPSTSCRPALRPCPDQHSPVGPTEEGAFPHPTHHATKRRHVEGGQAGSEMRMSEAATAHASWQPPDETRAQSVRGEGAAAAAPYLGGAGCPPPGSGVNSSSLNQGGLPHNAGSGCSGMMSSYGHLPPVACSNERGPASGSSGPPATAGQDAPPGGARVLPRWALAGAPAATSAPYSGRKLECHLPHLRFGGEIVYCATSDAVDAAILRLRAELADAGPHRRNQNSPQGGESGPGPTPEPAVGLDIEWKVSFKRGATPNKSALLQLCASARCCYLVHVFLTGVTPSLRLLLEDCTLRKVGVGIYGDAAKLWRDYGVTLGGVVDVSDVANRKLRPAGGSRKWGLSSLCEHLLCKQVAKGQGLRTGDWEASPLSAAQMRYAATDAFASLLLYQALQEFDDLAPLPVVPIAAPGPPFQGGGTEVAEAAAAAEAASGECHLAAAEAIQEEWVPQQEGELEHLPPTKVEALRLHMCEGLAPCQIAHVKSLKQGTVESYLADAMYAGHAYAWHRMGISDAARAAAVAAISAEVAAQAQVQADSVLTGVTSTAVKARGPSTDSGELPKGGVQQRGDSCQVGGLPAGRDACQVQRLDMAPGVVRVPGGTVPLQTDGHVAQAELHIDRSEKRTWAAKIEPSTNNDLPVPAVQLAGSSTNADVAVPAVRLKAVMERLAGQCKISFSQLRLVFAHMGRTGCL
eukprot:jgi/Mesen1/9403/ME000614S08659